MHLTDRIPTKSKNKYFSQARGTSETLEVAQRLTLLPSQTSVQPEAQVGASWSGQRMRPAGSLGLDQSEAMGWA